VRERAGFLIARRGGEDIDGNVQRTDKGGEGRDINALSSAFQTGDDRSADMHPTGQFPQAMAAMVNQLHRVVNHHVDRYNQGVVYGSSAAYTCRQATVVSSFGPMRGN
jgi:hypothetical protein